MAWGERIVYTERKRKDRSAARRPKLDSSVITCKEVAVDVLQLLAGFSK